LRLEQLRAQDLHHFVVREIQRVDSVKQRVRSDDKQDGRSSGG